MIDIKREIFFFMNIKLFISLSKQVVIYQIIFGTFIYVLGLFIQELKQLVHELRSDVIFNVSRTGGHLGLILGVVELTVALHYVFNAPLDRILWDVGHQVSIFLC